MQEMAMDQSGEEMLPQGMMSGMPLAEEMPSEGMMQRVPMALGGRVGYQDAGVFQPVSQMASYQASLPYEEDEEIPSWIVEALETPNFDPENMTSSQVDAYEWLAARDTGEIDDLPLQEGSILDLFIDPKVEELRESGRTGLASAIGIGATVVRPKKWSTGIVERLGKVAKERGWKSAIKRGPGAVKEGPLKIKRVFDKKTGKWKETTTGFKDAGPKWTGEPGPGTPRPRTDRGAGLEALRVGREKLGQWGTTAAKGLGLASLPVGAGFGINQLVKNQQLADAIDDEEAMPEEGDVRVENGVSQVFVPDYGWIPQDYIDRLREAQKTTAKTNVVPTNGEDTESELSYKDVLAQEKAGRTAVDFEDYPERPSFTTVDYTKAEQEIQNMGLSSFALERQSPEERKAEMQMNVYGLLAQAFGGSKNLGEAAEVIGKGLPDIAAIKRLHKKEDNELKLLERQDEMARQTLQKDKVVALTGLSAQQARIENEITRYQFDYIAGKTDHSFKVQKYMQDQNALDSGAARAIVETELLRKKIDQASRQMDISEVNSMVSVIGVYEEAIANIVLQSTLGVHTPEAAARKIDELRKQNIDPLQDYLWQLIGQPPRAEAVTSPLDVLGAAGITPNP